MACRADTSQAVTHVMAAVNYQCAVASCQGHLQIKRAHSGWMWRFEVDIC